MTQEKMRTLIEQQFRDDDRVCSSLSVFNIAGRIKKNYNHVKPPYLMYGIEIWTDDGNVAVSMLLDDVESIIAGKGDDGLDFKMKSGETVNIR